MTKSGALRASDADREAIVSRLHTAATEGRIGADELEQRVATALTARTYAELEATVADLPRPGGARRTPARQSGHWAVNAVRANPVLLVFAIPVLAVTASMLLAATILWAVLMVVVMVVGGHPRRGPWNGPWTYTRHRRPYRPQRRHPRSDWA
ncbi:MAG: DUF1707 domain-containing protein [Solirubrobacteraceae bacterium]